MDIVDKILNQSYVENAWDKKHKNLKKTKEGLMDNIIGIAALCKNPKNKRKYNLVQAREVYIKIRELLE